MVGDGFRTWGRGVERYRAVRLVSLYTGIILFSAFLLQIKVWELGLTPRLENIPSNAILSDIRRTLVLKALTLTNTSVLGQREREKNKRAVSCF